MDILSDILHVAGLRRRLLDLHALSPQEALRFPCDRSFGLHTAMHGQAYVHASNLDEPLALQAGDLVLMARGCVHLLSLDRHLPGRSSTVPIAHFASGLPDLRHRSEIRPRQGPFLLDLQPQGPATGQKDSRKRATATAQTAASDHGTTRVISAAYQLWHDPLHPFLRSLPPWFVIRGHSLPQRSALALTIGLLDRELGDQALGAASATHGLLDALFAFALREIAERENPGTPGWHHAIADRPIRQVLTLMHGDLGHGWTLEELGQRTGLSRSALAERFRSALGDTPLNHLRTLRMQKAMQLLSETRQTLGQVAQAVGYQDAFGFSKVFKRTTGQSPRQFREQDAKDRQASYRFEQA